ncbi:hypothetical protein [Leuconostoc lactis]
MTDIFKRDFTNFEIIIYNDLRHVIKMFVTDSDTFRKGLVENSAARKFLQEAYEDNLVNGYKENDSRVFDVHYVPVVVHPILIPNNESAEIDRPLINHFVFLKNGEKFDQNAIDSFNVLPRGYVPFPGTRLVQETLRDIT